MGKSKFLNTAEYEFMGTTPESAFISEIPEIPEKKESKKENEESIKKIPEFEKSTSQKQRTYKEKRADKKAFTLWISKETNKQWEQFIRPKYGTLTSGIIQIVNDFIENEVKRQVELNELKKQLEGK